jgi:hypothetical protein
MVFAFAGLCRRLADQNKRTTEIKAVRHIDFLNGAYINAQTFSPARAYGQLSVPLGSDFEFEKLLPALTNDTRTKSSAGGNPCPPAALTRIGRMAVAVEYNCPHG